MSGSLIGWKARRRPSRYESTVYNRYQGTKTKITDATAQLALITHVAFHEDSSSATVR